MSDWRDKFEPLTRGGLMWEILAERDGELWGRAKSDNSASWWPCVWRTDGEHVSGIHGNYLIPKRQPLRIKDVPLGFPCRIKETGETFTPYWIDSAGDIWGREEDGQVVSCFSLSDIDPDSIIETRKVWLTVYPHLYECNDYVGGCSTSEDTAKKHVYPSGFVYGPIRIPTKQIGG